jgi:hypothetical protein
MSVNLIKAYVKNILISLNEGVEASVTAKEMVDAINILPDVLRSKFPDMAYLR